MIWQLRKAYHHVVTVSFQGRSLTSAETLADLWKTSPEKSPPRSHPPISTFPPHSGLSSTITSRNILDQTTNPPPNSTKNCSQFTMHTSHNLLHDSHPSSPSCSFLNRPLLAMAGYYNGGKIFETSYLRICAKRDCQKKWGPSCCGFWSGMRMIDRVRTMVC